MSFAIMAPYLMVAAATDLAGIGSAISAADAAAAPTTGVLPAAADEVRRHWRKFAARRRSCSSWATRSPGCPASPRCRPRRQSYRLFDLGRARAG